MKKNFKFCLAILAGLFFVGGVAYGVDPTLFRDVLVTSSLKIGGSGLANSKSALEVNSTTKGLLLPRLTTTQRNAISSPPTGLQVYDTTVESTYIYNGAAWTNPTGQASYTIGDILFAWSNTGLTNLALGSTGQVLKSYGGTPTWGANGLIGDRELISNPDIDIDLSGYTAYADAAGSAPVDGTGGSPNSSIARTTSDPITGLGSALWTKAGGANRQGEGFSIPFTIGPADQGKNLEITFDYLVNSGTFTPGTDGSSATDSDIKVFIYDVTNSVLVPNTTSKLYSASSSTPAHFITYFPAPTCTPQPCTISTRLIFHTATTTTNNFTLKFDNISIHPPRGIGATEVITPWVDFTPTGSWTANTTYTGKWRRIGDSMEARIQMAISGTPTNASLDINMPTGMVIDISKFPGTPASVFQPQVGTGEARNASNNDFFSTVNYNTSTKLRVWVRDVSGTYAGIVNYSNTVPFTWASGDFVDLHWVVPIVGWSAQSGAVRTEDADTDWTSYTPTLIGSSSNPSLGTGGTAAGKYRRIGDSMEVMFTFVSGSSANAGSGNYSVSLPSGYSVDSNKMNSNGQILDHIVGLAQIDSSGSVLGSATVVFDSSTPTALSFWQFSGGTGGGSRVSNASPTSGWFAALSGNSLSGIFKVPIVGWTNNGRAPILIGSVTSNAQNAEKIERAFVVNTGSACTVTSSSGSWISTGTRNGSGDCSWPITGFSARPSCVCTVDDGNRTCTTNSSNTATSLRILTSNANASAGDFQYSIICMGPR